MNYDWILHPLTTYGPLAAGLLLSLYLFYTLKREAGAARKQGSAKTDYLEAALGAMERRVSELEAYLKDAEGGGAGATLQALNLTKRAKALRMYRRGESTSSIAAALDLPRNEVDLLIKIQRLVARPQNQQAA